MTIRVLIADDVPLARAALRRLLADESGTVIVRECGSGREAVDAIRADRPDLLLLDVQMPDLDGFGVLYELQSDEIPAVIFVTAYDQYALRAFDVHAADYLLKPVDPKRFHEAISRVRIRLETPSDNAPGGNLRELLREVAEQRRSYHRLAVPSGQKIIFLPTESVLCLEAAENYVMVHAESGKYLIRETITRIAERLDPAVFIRVHRSWVVNADKIREAAPWDHGTYLLVMENGLRVRASYSYRAQVESLLGKAPPRIGR